MKSGSVIINTSSTAGTDVEEGNLLKERFNSNNNDDNNNFINLLRKAFQLNLQCQISKT